MLGLPIPELFQCSKEFVIGRSVVSVRTPVREEMVNGQGHLFFIVSESCRIVLLYVLWRAVVAKDYLVLKHVAKCIILSFVFSDKSEVLHQLIVFLPVSVLCDSLQNLVVAFRLEPPFGKEFSDRLKYFDLLGILLFAFLFGCPLLSVAFE